MKSVKITATVPIQTQVEKEIDLPYYARRIEEDSVFVIIEDPEGSRVFPYTEIEVQRPLLRIYSRGMTNGELAQRISYPHIRIRREVFLEAYQNAITSYNELMSNF